MDLIGSLYCNVCKVAIPSENARETHNQGKRHQLALHAASVEQTKYKCSVFTRGWQYNTPKEKMIEFMGRFGEIDWHFVSKDNTFMIVKYTSPEVAKNLIDKGKLSFLGRKITISERKEPDYKEVQVEENVDDYVPILKIIRNQNSFGLEIDTLVSILQPDSQSSVQKYKLLCVDLEFGLQSIFPGCKVHPFGSTITGLAFCDSDVDAFIEVPDELKTRQPFYVEAVQMARQHLSCSSTFTKLLSIPRAKIPIVKCVHRGTGIKCDFNFKNMLGVCNSYFIQYFVRLDYKLKPCLLVIKFWAKLRQLAGSMGHFTNYALAIMFIFYVQCRYKFPSVFEFQSKDSIINIQDGWNGGFCRDYPVDLQAISGTSYTELLSGFFDFYESFDYKNFIICPYLGKPLERECFRSIESVPEMYKFYKLKASPENLRIDTDICIQDPFEHNRNIAGAVSSKVLSEWQEEMKRATGLFEMNQPHLIYNLCVDEYVPTLHEIYLKMPKRTNLQFLISQVNEQQANAAFELKKLWFATVNSFIIDVLKNVFMFEMTKVEDNETKEDDVVSLLFKSVYRTVIMKCNCSYNVWATRQFVRNHITGLKDESSELERQIKISKYIKQHLLKDVEASRPILYLKFKVEYFQIDARAIITLENDDLSEFENEEKYFEHFVAFFKSALPNWLSAFYSEENRCYTAESKNEKVANTKSERPQNASIRDAKERKQIKQE